MNKHTNPIFILLITCTILLGASSSPTLATPGVPQSASNVDLLGQLGGRTLAIAIQGDTAFIGVGAAAGGAGYQHARRGVSGDRANPTLPWDRKRPGPGG